MWLVKRQVDTVFRRQWVSSIGDDVVDPIAPGRFSHYRRWPGRAGTYCSGYRQRAGRNRKEQGNESPLNIIACENVVRGTTQLKGSM